MQANINGAVALALVMVLLSIVAFVLAQAAVRRLGIVGGPA